MPVKNRFDLALCIAQDRKLIGILTGAVPDCGPQPVRTSPPLGWSEIAVKPSGRGRGAEGWCRGQTFDVIQYC